MCVWLGSQLDQLGALCTDRFSCGVSFTKADPVDPAATGALVTVTRVMRLFSCMVRRHVNSQKIGLSQL